MEDILSVMEPSSSSLLYFTKAVLASCVASFAAVLYSECLYQYTRWLYENKKLLRYYPLPQNRNVINSFFTASSFTVPVSLFVAYYQNDLERSWNFNPFKLYAYTILYMIAHDTYFYHIHYWFHVSRPLYVFLHAMHHEYVYAMNVNAVAYAEVSENFIQVGIPLVFWTWFAGGNYWNWLLPLVMTVYSTLLGHGGYKSSPWLSYFNPFVLPLIYTMGTQILSPGDHQMHHSHRRCNYALFFRHWDRFYGTLRKCEVIPADVDHWKAWVKDEKNGDQDKKWLGKRSPGFVELDWGL